MVIREDLVAKVRHTFGLNTYEAKIWLALLSKGIASAGELADLAEVPRSRAYDVLESLERKGFVMAKLGKPIKYIAVSPKDVLARLKKRYEEEIKERMRILEELKDSDLIKELESIFSSKSNIFDISEKSGTIRGRHNIYGHLETMLRGAENKVYIIATETSFIRKIDALRYVFAELSERGVDIIIITPITEANVKYVKDLMETAQIYDAEDIRGRIVVVDEEEVMLMLFDDNEVHAANDIALWVYSPFAARAITTMIEKIVPSLKSAKEKLEEMESK